MIESLHIRNYALIEDLVIDFKPGLNIFTGSTGAGKTIIVGALGLALGERASEESIRTGSEETLVEAEISIQDREAFAGDDLDGADRLLVRREIKRDGRSKVVLNDRQITLTKLKDIGYLLADISGQHRQRGLTDAVGHLQIIDRYAGLGEKLSELAVAYKQYIGLKSKLDNLTGKKEQMIAEKELLEFQIKEIEAASLAIGEDEALEKEKLQLVNAEVIKTACQHCRDMLYNDDGAAAERLQSAEKELSRIAKYSDKTEGLQGRLQELSINLNEIDQAIGDLADNFEFDPGRLEMVEDRLALIKKIKRKYGQSIPEIQDFQDDAKAKAAKFEDLDGMIRQLLADLKQSQKELSEKGQFISAKRKEKAAKLEKEVIKHLEDLSMKGAQFKAGFRVNESETGPYRVGAENFNGDETGYDLVEFSICPNPGEELKPLASTASGGELSRILLAIISALVDAFPRETLVFDEIDSGISGEVASQVGKKLVKLAQSRQVICITHLQQIASRGQAHFKVYKGKSGGRLVTRVKALEGDQRIEEIARLLAGEKISDITLDSAAELLEEGQS